MTIHAYEKVTVVGKYFSCIQYGSYRRRLPSVRVYRVGEEDRDHVYASTTYTADDNASRSSRVNLQTGAILHLPRGRRDRNPGHVR